MATPTQLMTAEDLLRMPDDGFRYELVRGELRKTAAAGHRHGRVAINVTLPLGKYVQSHNLGIVYAAGTGFRLASDPDSVRAPDVAFVRRERAEAVGDSQGYWPGAPDLAIEVVSPSDTYTEVEEKILAWIDAGTGMVIVVNPRKRSVTVYRSRSDIIVLSENDVLDAGDVVPGWTMPVRHVFV
jgi:Uma2 family endonuclease